MASSRLATSLRPCFASRVARCGARAVTPAKAPTPAGSVTPVRSGGGVLGHVLALAHLRTPEAAARLNTTRAWSITGASTILPLSEMTPRP